MEQTAAGSIPEKKEQTCGSHKLDGENGARIRLEPRRNWEVDQPDRLANLPRTFEAIPKEINSAHSGRNRVSLAALIVPGDCAAVEAPAKEAGHDVKAP